MILVSLVNGDAKRLLVLVERLVILVSVAATEQSILFVKFPGCAQPSSSWR